MICDPLETKTSKALGGAKTLTKLATGNIFGIVSDYLSKRVRCNSCRGKDKNQDRWIIATVVGLFAGMYSIIWFSETLEDLLNMDIGGFTIFPVFA